MDWLPRIARDVCTGCEKCVQICPTHALAQHDGKADLVRPRDCIYCALCEDICPVDAIELPYLVIRGNNHETFNP